MAFARVGAAEGGEAKRGDEQAAQERGAILPDLALARLTRSTFPSSMIWRMWRSHSGALNMRLRSGSERKAPTRFCIGAVPSARYPKENRSNSFRRKLRTVSLRSDLATVLRKSPSVSMRSTSWRVASGCSKSAIKTFRKMCSMRTPHASGQSFLKTSIMPEAARAMRSCRTSGNDAVETPDFDWLLAQLIGYWPVVWRRGIGFSAKEPRAHGGGSRPCARQAPQSSVRQVEGGSALRDDRRWCFTLAHPAAGAPSDAEGDDRREQRDYKFLHLTPREMFKFTMQI
jgi:hypothetical protein